MPAPYYKEGVKHFHSGMQGAPTISNVAGQGISLLDACLKDGFGTLTLTSLVIASNVATATIAGGHLYTAHSVLQIAGASVAGGGTVNGQFKIKATGLDATHFTFDTVGVSDQSATGVITAKVAPLGWLKPFSGANLACYKSNDAASTGCYLRVDDSGATNMRVRGYESMSAVSTGTGLFPSTGLQASDGYWPKASNAGDRAWVLFGDERVFYLIINSGLSPVSGWSVGFGDFISVNTTDAFACGLIFPVADANNDGGAPNAGYHLFTISGGFGPSNGPNLYVPRAYHGAGASLLNGQSAAWPSTGTYLSGSANAQIPFPNPVDNALHLSEILVTDVGSVYRGKQAGIYGSVNKIAALNFPFDYRAILTDVSAALAGRAVMVVPVGNTYLSAVTPAGFGFVDITGPWR